MDEFFYNSVSNYFHALEYSGYMSRKKSESLLVLLFYYNLIYNDYRGRVTQEHYHTIEQALNCLYGSNCLIPYPDYLKMGKLKLGEMAEIIARIESFAKITIDGHTVDIEEIMDRLAAIEATQVVKGKQRVKTITDIDTSDS